ncbi:MAG: hypothetical protein WC455_21730 [Dehalococcoidia bacterium]|jgi:hypothetical protein
MTDISQYQAAVKEHRDKPFTVRDLIEHLKTINPELPVWYQMGFEEDFYPANRENAVPFTLADEEGNNEFEVCLIGDVP